MLNRRVGTIGWLPGVALVLVLLGNVVLLRPGEAVQPATPVPTVATPAVSEAGSAWVELGPSGAVIARAITSGACPDVTIDGATAPMSTRVAASPPAYPVAVCEAPVPPAARSLAVNGRPLRLPTAAPQRIAVIGDTGCRLSKWDGYQACNDPGQWPFATIAQEIANWHPDLVIHVGDYLYREDPCPAGNAGCAGSPWGYNWDAWQADFFRPAAPLLDAAPWIFVRGNHETCDRAGDGWFRFLDPRPYPPQCEKFTDPYPIQLDAVRLVVLDSAAAGDEQSTTAETDAFRQQFDAVGQLAGGNGWLVTHKPVWGVIENRSGSQVQVETESFDAATADRLPPGIDLVLSGHIHLAEILDFAADSARPPQLIAGNSGTELDRNVSAELSGQELGDAALSSGETIEEHGFLTLERVDSGLVATEHDAAGARGTVCLLIDKTAACLP